MDGIFIIDKPTGLTSHDVVSRVKRLLRTYPVPPPPTPSSPARSKSKVGHAGTLDPFATGVLPIVVGKATRLVEYLSDADKAYSAGVTLGATTDTYDREGEIIPTPGATMPSREAVERELQAFRGEIEQVPPMYSALKVGGQKLYDLARRGIEVERVARRVTISRLELESYNLPHLQLFVECSKGTYIRSLAHDLGAALGTGAYLESLVRTRVGAFTLDHAVTLEDLDSAFASGDWQPYLLPPLSIVSGWPVYTADAETEKALLQGKAVSLDQDDPAHAAVAAVTGTGGDLLAIVEWNSVPRLWQPKKVFGA